MIVVIDYGMGNIGSIVNMLKKVGASAVVSSDISTVEGADKLILPGVGAFDQGMRRLGDLGLIPVLNRKVLEAKTPILGLCLGMQLFTKKSEEGNLPGLGWFDAETVKFRFSTSQTGLKALHMGWNTVKLINPSPLWKDMYSDARFYFVHAYYVVCNDRRDIVSTSCYGCEFTSAICKENIEGTQFHPEKSHKFGIQLFRRFVECR